MSKLSGRIHWWSCDEHADHVDWCELEDAIRAELEYGLDAVPAAGDGSWPHPNATIEVFGYALEDAADEADLDSSNEESYPIQLAVKGWVSARLWARKLDLAEESDE